MMERLKALKDDFDIGMLNKVGHGNFCMRCLTGLPATMAEADPSRVAVGFYCLGALDILGQLETKVSETDRDAWRAWIWAQQVKSKSPGKAASSPVGKDVGPDGSSDTNDVGSHVGGFRPGPFMHVGLGIDNQAGSESTSDVQESSNAAIEADPPHLIMTYTALLSLAILRDDFTNLDREGLINLLRSTQKPDGSFTAFPGQGESDIRMVYTAFAISAMLDDWRGVDVPRAIAFTKRCMNYEGGFGQVPGNEAQGGSSYCALATLALAPAKYRAEAQLNTRERKRLERWLVQKQKPRQVYISYEEEDEEEDITILAPQLAQSEPRIPDDVHEGGNINGEVKNDKKVKVKEVVEEEGGGFAGRTEKAEDACYSFWCGAALRILRSGAVGGGRSSHFTASQANDILSSSACAAADNDNEDPSHQRQVRREEGVHSALEGGGEVEFIDRLTHARFISRCQFRLGGLGKAPGAHPDPYHTYLALAALALYPPPPYQSPHLRHNHPPSQTDSACIPESGEESAPGEAELLEEMKAEKKRRERDTWRVRKLDPLINATEETTRWAREKISQQLLD